MLEELNHGLELAKFAMSSAGIILDQSQLDFQHVGENRKHTLY